MLVTQETEIEICQRFVKLSCEKMMQSKGTGKLRRNLLILRLLRKARQDMHRVPYECAELIKQTPPTPPPKKPAPRTRFMDDDSAQTSESSLWRWKDRRSLNLDETVEVDTDKRAESSRQPTMTVVFDADADEKTSEPVDVEFDLKQGQGLSTEFGGKLWQSSRNEEFDEDERPPAVFQCDGYSTKSDFYNTNKKFYSTKSDIEFFSTESRSEFLEATKKVEFFDATGLSRMASEKHSMTSKLTVSTVRKPEFRCTQATGKIQFYSIEDAVVPEGSELKQDSEFEAMDLKDSDAPTEDSQAKKMVSYQEFEVKNLSLYQDSEAKHFSSYQDSVAKTSTALHKSNTLEDTVITSTTPHEITDLAYESDEDEDEFTDSECDDDGALLDGRSDEKRRLRKRKPHRSGSGRSEKRAKDADADSGVDVEGVVGVIDEQCVPSL
ncbi:unnamed protein product [Bursaphelenchus okinawaensis]|uniref:Uncharacterized protein n=1 Tax=Bursaphelenchus okinawaensis TaxID=465554 RepID=A0A811LJD1_9BILA|nr:unnamed protein product [Bursaphelenchus okinawaensis]CAG9123517.1 unnamed protein product [Bursaphelenchus okinawaensis]